MKLRLPPAAEAPALARRAVEVLRGHVAHGVVDDVLLLSSELVTNSVRHAGLADDEWIELRLSSTENRVRVDVLDDGPGFELDSEPQSPTPSRASGWGLYLVREVANRWGVNRDGPTDVWFEIATDLGLDVPPFASGSSEKRSRSGGLRSSVQRMTTSWSRGGGRK